MKKGKLLASALTALMTLSGLTPVAAASSRVENLLAKMSLRQKVTQMLMVDFRYWDTDLTDDQPKVGFVKMNDQVKKIVEDYDFGSIIYFAQNIVETEQSFNLTQDLQEAAIKDGGIPLLISADQEGGSVYRLGSGTALPGNMALGATGDVKNAEEAGKIIGRELSVLGINTNLAPVVDVNNNANNPVIGLRSYSDDADIVGQMASATIKGLADYNVIGCAKHFPGHGDTATDSHYGLPVVDKSKEVLLQNELKPYKIAINQGIEMIMTAHILYPQLDSSKIVSDKTGEAESLPSTMSKAIITDLLKGEMGFKGIVCTDAMNMAGIAAKWDQVQSVKVAIAAGIDMICMPCTLYSLEDLKNLDAIINGVVSAVESGEIPESRLDDACRRILTVKENRGILDYKASDYSLDKALSVVGSQENRESEREIAANAVTVIKNKDNVLPLKVKDNSKVLMLCPYNNERAQMVVAWNRAKEAGLVPEGAECKVYRFANATINNELKELLDWADTVIINSEISSTDRMEYKHWLSDGPNKFVNYCHENGKTSIVMSVDKPYDVQLYPNANAILAVYGCKGSSIDVTEALTGGVTADKAAFGPNIIAGIEVALGTFAATGKLPVNIPQYNLETNSYTDEIIYKRGYGLTYNSLLNKDKLIAAIEEVSKLEESKYTAESWSALSNAVTEAKKVVETNGISQAKIDAAEATLRSTINALVIKQNNTEKPQSTVDVPVIDTSKPVKEVTVGVVEAEKVKDVISNSIEKDTTLKTKVDTAVAAGKDVNTEVVIKNIEETKIDATVKKEIDEKIKDKDLVVAQYLDLSVVVSTEDEVLGNVTELTEAITYKIAIPADLAKESREFVVIRVHNGVAEILPTTMNDDGTLSFKTDRFSTYALAYKDVEKGPETIVKPNEPVKPTTPEKGEVVNTSDQSNIALYVSLCTLALLGAGIVVLNKKREKKLR